MILQAALDGFNLEPVNGIKATAKLGLLSGDAPTTLDLDALALHSLIGHDASISRQEFALDDLLYAVNASPGVDYYNVTSAGQVMHDRLAVSLASNPNITNTGKEQAVRTGESALYLSVMGDPIAGIAADLIFFREERLPIAEEWTRPRKRITSATLHPIVDMIAAASMWEATQACEDLILGPNLTI
ncbi:hypothetical protein B0H13DRAFT_2226288 [Mycena leptocephala]|nr:hypothetical protein B0H13DRAFT_2226288 [Mycena leptocephala]